MDEGPLTLEKSFQLELLSDKNNSYSLEFNLNSCIEIIANQINNIINRSYSNKYSFEEIRETKYFLQFDTFSEILDEIKIRIDTNKIVIKENENKLIINVPLPSTKNKEIIFELNPIIKSNNERLNDLTDLIIKLNTEMNKIKNENMQSKNEEIINLKNEIKQLNDKYNNLEKKEIQLNNENTQLKKEINNFKDKETQLKSSNDQIIIDINFLKSENTQLKNEANELKNNNTQLKNEVDKLKNEVTQLKNKNILLENEINQFKNDNIQSSDESASPESDENASPEFDKFGRKSDIRLKDKDVLPENVLGGYKGIQTQITYNNNFPKNKFNEFKKDNIGFKNKNIFQESESNKYKNNTIELKYDNYLLKKGFNRYKNNNKELKNNMSQFSILNSYMQGKKIITNLNSKIINGNKIYNKRLKNWIRSSRKIKAELLYRLSKNGNSISKFHELCDDKGRTLTLFHVIDGNIVGIYTPSSWDSVSSWKNDKNTFIFNLTKNQKCKKVNISRSIFCGFLCGPLAVGFGSDKSMKTIIHYGDDINEYFDNGSEILPSNNQKKEYDLIETEVYKIIIE